MYHLCEGGTYNELLNFLLFLSPFFLCATLVSTMLYVMLAKLSKACRASYQSNKMLPHHLLNYRMTIMPYGLNETIYNLSHSQILNTKVSV